MSRATAALYGSSSGSNGSNEAQLAAANRSLLFCDMQGDALQLLTHCDALLQAQAMDNGHQQQNGNDGMPYITKK